MPKRKVKPYRPTVGEIQRMLRDPGDDAHWIDDAGRAYGFMRSDYSRLLWKRGALDEDEAHLWVLLPRPRAHAKVGEIVTFPPPDAPIDLRPYVRPQSHARLRIGVRRYLYRPRRQRAAALVATVELFSRIEVPTGSALAEISDEENEPKRGSDSLRGLRDGPGESRLP